MIISKSMSRGNGMKVYSIGWVYRDGMKMENGNNWDIGMNIMCKYKYDN